jgi:hypothetical protein
MNTFAILTIFHVCIELEKSLNAAPDYSTSAEKLKTENRECQRRQLKTSSNAIYFNALLVLFCISLSISLVF